MKRQYIRLSFANQGNYYCYTIEVYVWLINENEGSLRLQDVRFGFVL